MGSAKKDIEVSVRNVLTRSGVCVREMGEYNVE